MMRLWPRRTQSKAPLQSDPLPGLQRSSDHVADRRAQAGQPTPLQCWLARNHHFGHGLALFFCRDSLEQIAREVASPEVPRICQTKSGSKTLEDGRKVKFI